MRLLQVFQAPDYRPIGRGDALPQFHEDGDKYSWQYNMLWNYEFWRAGVAHCEIQNNTFNPTWLMGGEL